MQNLQNMQSTNKKQKNNEIDNDNNKDTIENSEKIKELRANLNNIQTTLKTLIKNIIELPFVQSYLINSTNLTLQNISDIKVSDLVETFEKIKERIKEDEKNFKDIGDLTND